MVLDEKTGLYLSDGERILGSWNYAKLKGKIASKGATNLTVTNKRVISRAETKQGITRSEMPVDSVQTISGSVKVVRLLPLLILGIIGLAAFGLGIILLLIWYFYKRKAFTLIITAPLHDDGMIVGRTPLATKRRKKAKTKELKMIYDEKVTAEILDTFGAVIASRQN